MVAEKRAYIQALARHLPPSGAVLRLLDIGGQAGSLLAEQRGDLHIITLDEAADWPLPPDSVDAVAGYDSPAQPDMLKKALTVLRPGGRLIIVRPSGQPEAALVTLLEQAGYTRILVEPALDSGGLLLRGEKPHTEQRTVDRISQVADSDITGDWAGYRGRYVHLLVRQSPNKPVWALRPDEQIEWRAAALEQGGQHVLLAFSSLPKAVAFMQPAVMAGLVKDVNKVAKFSKETAQSWPQAVLFNPTAEMVEGWPVVLLPVDPSTAEAPDE